MMKITPLGGAREVGRSCILLQFNGRTIMLDCGSHPGKDGELGLPFFDGIPDPSQIDIILISHFHIDHCAALPFFVKSFNFKGRIFMTHATKAVMKLLLADNIRLQHNSLYTLEDLENCMDLVEVVDFHETIEHNGIKFTASAAGHVLGAAMFMIEIDGTRILYTGDYSKEEDRHLSAAETPRGRPPDVLIIESTFGTNNLDSRQDREKKFIKAVETIVKRGGSCLIPVFALGRAQELLLILEEMWEANPDLRDVRIFFASILASKALRVYQTFVHMMNRRIRSLMDVGNPFDLRHISNYQDSSFDSMGRQVVMAAPGFMQSGVSRALFEKWCDNPLNGVIIAGYTVEGTLAHELLTNKPKIITTTENRQKDCRCLIENVSFTAHVDFNSNLQFMKETQPHNIILVHGEETTMLNLKRRLQNEIRTNWPTGYRPSVFNPAIGEDVIPHLSKASSCIQAELLGSAANIVLEKLDQSDSIETILPPDSVLVTENFTSKLVSSSDLPLFTSCRLGNIFQRMTLPIPLPLTESLRKELLQTFLDHLQEIFDIVTANETGLMVQDAVSLSLASPPEHSQAVVVIEWQASPSADILADAVVGSISEALSAPSLLKQSFLPSPCSSKRSSEHRPLTHPALSVSPEIPSDFDSELVKRMKGGEIDPSRAILPQLKKAGSNPDPAQTRRLRDFLVLLEVMGVSGDSQGSFSYVGLNGDGDKLIFRSQSKGSDIPSEAYCYIRFKDESSTLSDLSEDGLINTPTHVANISSSDPEFRSLVVSVIQKCG